MDKKKWESLDYVLSKNWLITIIVYYILLILVGIVVSVVTLANLKILIANNILLYTCILSMSVSCMLCSVQYLKRLYKACINDRVKLCQPGEELRQYGNILYFFLRPLYAIVFVLISVFALLSGVIIVTSVDFQINERFLYLCVVMSSIIGFSIGRILDVFETVTVKQINDALKNKE